MTGFVKSTGYGFHFVVWAVIIVSIALIVAGSADLLFGLRWGFSPEDVIMAVVVLLIALLLKVLGGRIISMFGG
jgi:hypothetical protein